jgi:pyruvate kinase
MVENARRIAEREFNLNKGDLIVVTGGFPLGEANKTNYLRIMEI